MTLDFNENTWYDVVTAESNKNENAEKETIMFNNTLY